MSLRPSKTKAYRRASLTRIIPGVVVVQLDEARREGLTATPRRYLLIELPAEPGERVFRFTKRGGEEPHYVCLSTGKVECDCTGFEKSNWCSHCELTVALTTAGALPAAPVLSS